MWIVRSDRCMNLDTGAMVQVRGGGYDLDNYEACIEASGPIGGWWDSQEMPITTDMKIYYGTLEECQRYFQDVVLEFLSSHYRIQAFNETGTPKPEEVSSGSTTNYERLPF